MRMRKASIAGLLLLAALGLPACNDAADTDVDVPDVDIPETISPGDLSEEEGEGGGG